MKIFLVKLQRNLLRNSKKKRKTPKTVSPKNLRKIARQLEEDAQDCWGIRRKLNLKSAAKTLYETANFLESRD